MIFFLINYKSTDKIKKIGESRIEIGALEAELLGPKVEKNYTR